MCTDIRKPQPWTAEEKEILRRSYAASTADELLRLLPGRNLSAIYRKASGMGLRRTQTGEWTREEMDILSSLYSKLPARHIQPHLPGRSLSAIYHKASELCLTAYDNAETDRIISENFGLWSLSRIARRIGCCCSSVRSRAQVLGLI